MADLTVHGSLAAQTANATKGHSVRREVAMLELDCDAAGLSGLTVYDLVPADTDTQGLLILEVWGITTEIFGGGTQDQGIVVLKDTASSPNTIATWTAANAAADALGDKREANLADWTGLADGSDSTTRQVAAGLGLTLAVTQQTSGSSVAGKVLIGVEFVRIPKRITEKQ